MESRTCLFAGKGQQTMGPAEIYTQDGMGKVIPTTHMVNFTRFKPIRKVYVVKLRVEGGRSEALFNIHNGCYADANVGGRTGPGESLTARASRRAKVTLL
jgi:hypothetical protein